MRKVYLLLFLFCWLSLTSPISAEGQGKFIVILLDQLSLNEIAQSGGEELTRLFVSSAEALLNVRTDNGIESAYTYTAFGAGSRGEKYGAIPGLLPRLLTENGYTLAAYGNSDYGTEERREVLTIAGNDSSGYSFYGDVSDAVLLSDPEFPGRLRTNYRKLVQEFRAAYTEHDLIILEVGDIGRIKTGRERGEISEIQENALLRATFARFDDLLSQVLQTMDFSQDTLMLAALTPDLIGAQRGEKLTWVLLLREGSGQGFLSTSTTRRPGLATISDLAPTILQHFQIPVPAVMNGQPLYSVDRDRFNMKHLIRYNQQIHRTSEWRPWFIKGFILVQIIVITFTIIAFVGRRYIPRSGWRVIRFMLLAIMTVPAAFLLISPYWVSSFLQYIILFFLFVIGVAWYLEKTYARTLVPVTILVTATCGLLFIDIFRNSPWIARSLLGYCPVIGARFYGVGNEYMGIVVGGTLIGWTALLERYNFLKRHKYVYTLLVFLAVIVIIGAPFLGANFGGILTAMAAFSLSYVLMFEKSRRKKIILFSGALMLTVLSIILLADTYGWTGEQSHLGRTINLLKVQGMPALTNIVWRKLSMNLKLLRWTIWTRVLLSFIVVLALLFKRPRGVLSDLVLQYPHLAVGFTGALLGSVVTMAVNDSGVVAAATLLFFAIFPLLYLVLSSLEPPGNLQKSAGGKNRRNF